MYLVAALRLTSAPMSKGLKIPGPQVLSQITAAPLSLATLARALRGDTRQTWFNNRRNSRP